MRHHFAHIAAGTAAALLAVTSVSGVLVGQTRAPELKTYHITAKDVPPASESVPNPPKMVPRPDDARLVAPPGFTATLYAEGLFKRPRVAEEAQNGDLFVVDTGANSVVVLRDANGDHRIDASERHVFAEDLKQPYGLAFHQGHVYVANTDSVVRFAYAPGQTQASGPPELVTELPTGKGHWTRNIVFSPDGGSFYVTVGSSSNVDPEDDPLRATVLRFDADGSNRRVVVSQVRNAVGFAFHPETGEPWMTVQERDGIGDEVPPDYISRVVDGATHGFPYYYTGSVEEPRHKGARPDLAGKVAVPDVLIQAHSSILGMTFYDHTAFPARYRGGAFAALRGSSSRAVRTGYKVIFVPFDKGTPTGGYEDFLVGWMLGEDRPDVWGRPVDVTMLRDGSLLVVDDGAGTVWRVAYRQG
jgi:glucose/arabinose dehydrogenase